MNRDIVQNYVKNPITVSAIQYNGANFELVREFAGKKASAFHRKSEALYINTLEGMMLVGINDYVVRGIVGEFYAVKQHIFELTYEVVHAS